MAEIITAEEEYTFEKKTDDTPVITEEFEVAPPSNYDDGGTKPSQKRWRKVGYKLNPFVDEVQPPHIILVNRRLQKIGEIVNVTNFRQTLKELNQANEISFTVYKKLVNTGKPNQTLQDKETISDYIYERIQDLAVVYVNGEFFEIGITNHEDASIQKNVVGVSLGYAELSQVITSLQINTDDDLIRRELEPYQPKLGKQGMNCATIFYNPVQVSDDSYVGDWRRLTSLLDRVLSAAPHYEVGVVDESLRNVQREFSWEDTDVLTILNDIGQEVGCVFDITVSYDINGDPIRKVNAYDLAYCKYCWNKVRDTKSEFEGTADSYRNIQNGACQNCKGEVVDGYTRTGAEDIVEIGTNTGIFLSSENLTDDITVDGNKDEIKTAFKVVGGDDYMTDTVTGLNVSGENRIMLFPPYMMKNFSKGLYDNYSLYRDCTEIAEPVLEELMERIYNLQDIIQYLKSGKMPVSDEPITEVDEEFVDISKKIERNFYNYYYIDTKDNYSKYAVGYAVRTLMTAYLQKGFGLKVEVDEAYDYNKNTSNNTFYGRITIYRSSDPNDCINVYRLNGKGTKITVGNVANKEEQPYNGEKETELKTFINNITFKFGSNSMDYAGWIKQYCSNLLSKNALDYENDKEKDWSKYSYERLRSYADGYESCINVLDAKYQSALPEEKKILRGIRETYTTILGHIQVQMNIVRDQLYALCKFNGAYEDMFMMVDENDDRVLNPDYKIQSGRSYRAEDSKATYPDNTTVTYKVYKPVSVYTNTDDIFKDTISSNQTYVNEYYTIKCNIGNYPVKCKVCGSSNVELHSDNKVECNRCHNWDASQMYTYYDNMEELVEYFNRYNQVVIQFAKQLSDKGVVLRTTTAEEQRIYGDTIPIETLLNNDNTRTLLELRDNLQKVMDIHRYLDPQEFAELMSYVRTQVYSNPNYISDGLTDEEVIGKAKELMTKAKRELAKSCMPQYSITMSVGSIVALEPYEFLGETYNTDLANFAINNFIHVKMDDDIYKLRIASIELSYPMSDKISVSFTNAERFINGFSSDIASILASAQSMATSFTYVATQANQGASAKASFDYVKQQGLNTALMAIKSGRNQDIVIDDTGILLRMLNEYTNEYDPHQMKMINNEIVMTDDNWKTARLAIGLTLNPRWTEGVADEDAPQYLYGVYADAIVGDIIVGKTIRRIGNANENDLCTVEINRNGIEISNGLIDIFDPQYDNRAIINPCGMAKPTVDLNNGAKPNLPGCNKDFPDLPTPEYKNLLYYGQTKGQPQFWVTRTGDAFFAGTLVTKRGRIANWYIIQDAIYTDKSIFGDISKYREQPTTLAGYNDYKKAVDEEILISHRTDDTNAAAEYFGSNGLIVGKNFAVNKYGQMFAKDAYFDGHIIAKSGKIANWIINPSSFYTENFTWNGDMTNPLLGTKDGEQYFGVGGLFVGSNFCVMPDGTLYSINGLFKGTIQATSGVIGGWKIGTSCIWRGENPTAIASNGQAAWGTEGCMYYGDLGFSVGSKLWVDTDGVLNTQKLNIYEPPSGSPEPVYENAAGISMDLQQGGFYSKSLNYKPWQLHFIGIKDSGQPTSGSAYIGTWQEGRIIIGKKDFGNPDEDNSAFKMNVDGSVYISGKIHFGHGKSGKRYVLKLVEDKDKTGEYIVKAVEKTVSVKTWNGSGWS